jgi:hypothetical protein
MPKDSAMPIGKECNTQKRWIGLLGTTDPTVRQRSEMKKTKSFASTVSFGFLKRTFT